MLKWQYCLKEELFFIFAQEERSCKAHSSEKIFLGFICSLGWDDRLGTDYRVDFNPLQPHWFHITKPTAASDSFQDWTEIEGRSCDLSALQKGQELICREPQQPRLLNLERPLIQGRLDLTADTLVLISTCPHPQLIPRFHVLLTSS